MRIGTWNLAGRWTGDHQELLLSQACEVWLLTEVSEKLELPGYFAHATSALMAPRRHWAAVLSRGDLKAMPDPHPATAAAEIGDAAYVSSVLPWRSSGRPDFWGGHTHVEKMAATLRKLEKSLTGRTVVWGGDWNQALVDGEYTGTKAGRRDLLDTIASLGLFAATARLPHRISELRSIDHIAVPADAVVTCSHRVVARSAKRRLSDHDMYVVDVARF